MSPPAPRLDDLRIERTAKPATPRHNGRWIFVVVALLAIAAAVWWSLGRAKAIPVRVAVARELTSSASGRTVLNASGYVTARREATVSSKVIGKITEVLVEEGISVKAGQVLARLDASNIQGMLDLAEAQLAAAKASLEETRVRLREAELDLSRQTALSKTNVAARAEFDRAEAAANAWRARLAQQQAEQTVAERSLAIQQQQLDDMIIRAPFAGVVTSKNAQPGEMISPMSAGGFTRTGICTLVDMESLEIEIDVNESYLNRVTPGQGVDAALDAYPEWKIPCKVIAIIPTADRQKSTVKVRVGFDKLDPRILPQMAVKVAFRDAPTANAVAATTRPASPSIVIPKAALRSESGRDIVFVVREQRAERRAVNVARAQDNDVTLSAGVSAGERVIVEASVPLTDGVAITIR